MPDGVRLRGFAAQRMRRAQAHQWRKDLCLRIRRTGKFNRPCRRNCVGLADQNQDFVRHSVPCDKARVGIVAWPVAFEDYERVRTGGNETDCAIGVGVRAIGQNVRGAEEVAVAEERVRVNVICESVAVEVSGVDAAADRLYIV